MTARGREQGENLREKLDVKRIWVLATLMSSSLQVLLREVLQEGGSEPAQGPELIQRLNNSKLFTVYC